MRQTISLNKAKATPSLPAVLRSQGIPDRALASKQVIEIAEMALMIHQELAAPAGIIMDIDAAKFRTVYAGHGLNEESTPLDLIVPKAEQFALFAVTLGQAISDRISLLFDEQEFALGALLDSTASASAEMACNVLLAEYQGHLDMQGKVRPASGILPFSPGYCGWHISAQRALFDVLQPDGIGIALGETFLMEPLKSISGVFVLAPKTAFEFEDDFPFCATCRTRTCRGRIADLAVQ